MKNEYITNLKDAKKHIKLVRKYFDDWQKTDYSIKTPAKGATYKNYILIYAYGTIEYTFKNLIADYFCASGMPQRCIQFGNKIRDRLPGSMAKDMLNKFIGEECSKLWLQELKKRCDDTTTKCKINNKITVDDAYIALTSLTNSRHAFAHSAKPYTGEIDDLMNYYKKSVAFLYEIDDIINTIG